MNPDGQRNAVNGAQGGRGPRYPDYGILRQWENTLVVDFPIRKTPPNYGEHRREQKLPTYTPPAGRCINGCTISLADDDLEQIKGIDPAKQIELNLLQKVYETFDKNLTNYKFPNTRRNRRENHVIKCADAGPRIDADLGAIYQVVSERNWEELHATVLTEHMHNLLNNNEELTNSWDKANATTERQIDELCAKSGEKHRVLPSPVSLFLLDYVQQNVSSFPIFTVFKVDKANKKGRGKEGNIWFSCPMCLDKGMAPVQHYNSVRKYLLKHYHTIHSDLKDIDACKEKLPTKDMFRELVWQIVSARRKVILAGEYNVR